MTNRIAVSLGRASWIACGGLALTILSAHAQTPQKPDTPAPLSLKSEREIHFSTNEGTWISLDVSPDGKTIVFELLGDIYTLPVTGGTAQPLMTGMAFDSQPRFSPDGKQFVFISDRDGADNVWISDVDGSHARAITKERHTDWISPEWTPDGQFVMAEKSSDVFGGRELWMFDRNGGAGIQVTKASPAPKTPSDKQNNVAGAVASPDGKYLYYSQRAGLFGYNAKFPLWQIVRRNTATGVEDVITAEQGSAIRPRISPDGRWLVYGTRQNVKTGLRARDLATGSEHWLRYGIDRDDQEGIASRDLLPGYAFTPDSKAIVVSYGGRLHRIEVESAKVADIPFTANVKQPVGPLVHSAHRVEDGPVVARIASDVHVSPDGQHVAFSALAHLYTASLSGGAPQRLTKTDDAEFQPAWSPDGRFVAYVIWDAVSGGAIWKVAADGSGSPTRLTSVAGYYKQPVWSPDGKDVLAIRSSVEARRGRRMETQFNPAEVPAGDELISVPADGGDVQTIVAARGMSRPQFTTTSDRIFLDSGKGLVSMRRDGSDVQEIVILKGKDTQGKHESVVAREVAIRPDGSMGLALINHQVWLFQIPHVGGSAVEVEIDKPSISAKRLTVDGADAMTWSHDGNEIVWTVGASIFRLPLADALTAVAKDNAVPPSSPALPSTPAAAAQALKPTEIVLHVEEPRAIPSGSVVLRGANIITMNGDQVLRHADLVVTGDRIVAVGATGKVQVPSGAKILNVTGKTIIPGIIDVHAHYTTVRRGVMELENWPFAANLAYGVTSGRDPQTFSTDIFAYQDLADTGRILGPRAFSTGPGIFSENDFHSLDDAKHTVERYTRYYRTHLLKSYEVGNRQQRQWMVEASTELKAMPTTEGGIDLKLDLTHAIDGFSGNEHNLPQTPIYNDVAQMYAQSGIAYTPTLVVAYGGPTATQYFIQHTEVHDDPKVRHFIPPLILAEDAERGQWVRDAEYIFPQQAADAAKILRAGGKVGLGGHGMMQGLQCHWEIWAMAMGGMTPMEALSVATIHSAEAIGLEQDLGSLVAGKLADLVVLDANPLENIRNTNTVHWVMRGGIVYEGDTLDEVWPQTKKYSESWWHKEEAGRNAVAN